MSIYFSLQSPLSAPVVSTSLAPYFASLHASRDYAAPACSCRLTFLKQDWFFFSILRHQPTSRR
jgi:hypothetical protein